MRARFQGPLGHSFARLLVDTGAQFTLINESVANEIGVESDGARTVYGVTGATRIGLASVPQVDCIGLTRRSFRVGLHTLPPALGIDGLLGLDFLRDTRLTLDFRNNVLTVA